ncbi:hypothetical protein [Phyllobacterium sp. OV277]|uniref:hypothetical protein n=1 Tax=Phyllobacterium sp. OV277 TaxID=1882772 RepID=UPI0008924FFE|nr:hypothetical protein [Phyllobacterium sp. OV277]SDN83593.1 hypothetical protein SAMN05443582_101264 [Phyllobacterium sp. OV277]
MATPAVVRLAFQFVPVSAVRAAGAVIEKYCTSFQRSFDRIPAIVRPVTFESDMHETMESYGVRVSSDIA